VEETIGRDDSVIVTLLTELELHVGVTTILEHLGTELDLTSLQLSPFGLVLGTVEAIVVDEDFAVDPEL